jgi:UDP-N-acetylmuramoyl-tripeptide--D-alanyl-D-alanine ligase
MMTLDFVCQALEQPTLPHSPNIKGICTDSRSVSLGDLFVALKGPNFNGHDFLSQAFSQGAIAAITSEVTAYKQPCIQVNDARLALGKLAAAWRQQFRLPLIALTGSNGKTTVKEMLVSILSQLLVAEETLCATKGNLNNEIGVPLTLFALTDSSRHAVIEMGANHAGEIAYLTQLAKPDVALVNNASRAHLEGFGSVEKVAKAKAEIFSGLSSDGIAVFNADDIHAPLWREKTRDFQMLTFGLMSEDADVKATVHGIENGQRLDMMTPEGSMSVRLSVSGRHNAMNALAATAGALALGVSPQHIVQGLENFLPVKGRLQFVSGYGQSQLINDSYNANPDSLLAAIDVLSNVRGKRMLVLGDMGELGADAEALHEAAGVQAKTAGIDGLTTLGSLASHALNGFSGGQSFSEISPLVTHLKTFIEEQRAVGENVTLLIKASRFMRMERVIQALQKKEFD